MQKRKRYFTIMIVPHSEEATYSFRLPLFVGQLIVALIAAGMVAFFVLAYVYRNALQDAEELRILRQANQVLQDEINAFANQTQQILEQFAEMEKIIEKILEWAGKVGIEQKTQSRDTGSRSGTSTEETRLYSSRSDHDRVLERVAVNLSFLQSVVPEKAETLEMLRGEVDEYLRRLAATPSIWPTRGRVTSGFGMRRDPFGRGSKFHHGIDIAGAYGTPVYATASGQVINASYRGGFGNLVIIRHGYGFETYYAHLSGFAVSTGQWVKRGQVIGYMGRSGTATGPHLHYEVHVNGVAVNPYRYLN